MHMFSIQYSFTALCLVAAVGFILGRWSKRGGPVRQRQVITRAHRPADATHRATKHQPNAAAELSANARQEVEQLLGRGKLIAAIKVVRADLGLGLKDSKDLIDNMRH